MARAYGSSAHLLMKRETVYGQAATGNYLRMPFNRCNLGSEQGLIDDPVLGQGRDPLAPLQDVITDEGEIVVPVDPRYLGLWLTGLFGDPDTTDNLDGSWDQAELDCPRIHPLRACGRYDQRDRPGRDPLRHEPGRDADQPDLQPHQP